MAQLEALNHYRVSVQTVNTKDYGVPQSRHRMYIVGVPKSGQKYVNHSRHRSHNTVSRRRLASSH